MKSTHHLVVGELEGKICRGKNRIAGRTLMKRIMLSTCVTLMNGPIAYAIDLYDANSAILSVPSLVIGASEYLNVEATLGPVIVLSVASPAPTYLTTSPFRVPPPLKSTDRFDPVTNILTVPGLSIGASEYKDVRVRLGAVTVNSVGRDVPYFEPPPSPGN